MHGSMSLQRLRTVCGHIHVLEDYTAIGHKDDLKVAVCGHPPKDGYFVLYDHPVEDSNSRVARTDNLVVDTLSFLWAGCFAADTVVISLAMTLHVDIDGTI